MGNRGAVGELRDVRAGDEGFVARSRKNCHAHRIIGAQLIENRGAFSTRLNVERVSFFGTVDSNERDPSTTLEQNGFVPLTHFAVSVLLVNSEKVNHKSFGRTKSAAIS